MAKSRSMHRCRLLLLAVLVAALDQMIKSMIARLDAGQVLLRINPLFEIVHTSNTGAAFSLLKGQTSLILIATTLLLAVLGVLLLFDRNLSQPSRIALAFLLGGGMGNWIDRVAVGSVTDYVRLLFISFPVFNLADICITLSVFLLLALVLTNRFENRQENRDGRNH